MHVPGPVYLKRVLSHVEDIPRILGTIPEEKVLNEVIARTDIMRNSNLLDSNLLLIESIAQQIET